jgi:uncharacterized protein (TIGR02687 family)
VIFTGDEGWCRTNLKLQQIIDKLNAEFAGEGRRFIFWYDANGEFANYIRDLELENAKIHYLTHNNLFKTKVLLEREDTESNYLVYAPFPKPDSRENHLADTIKYSKEFFTDKATLIAVDLGTDDNGKKVLKKHIKFFDSKERTKRFYDLEVDKYNENTIEITLLSALAKSKVSDFEEVLRIILTSGDLVENEYLIDSQKYRLDKVFWKHCRHTFSYVDEEPSLIKLAISLFLTYTQKEINSQLPASMKIYILNNIGTVMAFMTQFMNNMLYREDFDILSDEVFRRINGVELFKNYPVEDIVDLDIFRFVDKRIIGWIIERLLDENLNATVNNISIPELCRYRGLKHFGREYINEYNALRHAYYIISNVNYKAEPDVLSIIKKYDSEDYKIDTHYRKFYYYLDQVRDIHKFDELQELVENIYTNKYLDVIAKEFNNELSYEAVKGTYKLQRDFYNNFVAKSKEKLVVIISDAFRYEVAKELVKRLERDKKADIVSIEPQIGVIPSHTALGMASLLPHEELIIDENYDVYVDGKPCSNLVERDGILKARDANAACIQFDVLKKYKQNQLKAFFVGKSVVYIYHDQIDARGSGSGTEDEVLAACEEAIEEIKELIKRLTDSVSRTKYIVTADHGFIYKRNKIAESDKIDRFFTEDDQVNRRFVISDNKYEVTGTKSLPISETIGGYNVKAVTFPLTSSVFKVAGGSQNFVHGGSSPQEILVPVVQVKTLRGYIGTENVKVALISMLPRITSLVLNLDFVQQQAISDVVKPTTYKFAFVDEAGNIISNEEMHLANSTETETAKRIFRLGFNFKNQKYERNKKYYLIGIDTETGMEVLRHQVIIDIPFADDFGFDL